MLLQRLKLESSRNPAQFPTLQTAKDSMAVNGSDSFKLPPACLTNQAGRRDSSSQTHQLAVQTTKQEGRQLVAAQQLPAGTPVWTEQPFAHVLYRQHIKQVGPCTPQVWCSVHSKHANKSKQVAKPHSIRLDGGRITSHNMFFVTSARLLATSISPLVAPLLAHADVVPRPSEVTQLCHIACRGVTPA